MLSPELTIAAGPAMDNLPRAPAGQNSAITGVETATAVEPVRGADQRIPQRIPGQGGLWAVFM